MLQRINIDYADKFLSDGNDMKLEVNTVKFNGHYVLCIQVSKA